MLLASLNCNKRLSSIKNNKKLQDWLGTNNIDLALIQEPSPHHITSMIDLPGYRSLGGNTNVYTWIREGFTCDNGILIEPFMQRITLADIAIFNMYFDAYSRKIRTDQLNSLKNHLALMDSNSVIVAGDFNLAPRSEDGMSGNSFSHFNGPNERRAFTDILEIYQLIDTTSNKKLGEQMFSIERVVRQVQVRFRCDLCLVSNQYYSRDGFFVRYDHSVRDKITGFTDHSALIINLPGTFV